MKIENLKEFLDNGFYINRYSKEDKKISFRKYGNGFYRFFIGKTLNNAICIESKDWNTFIEKVKYILKDEKFEIKNN